MNILAVDDEPRGLNMLTRAIRQAEPAAMLSGFQNPLEALTFAGEHWIDIAFLDVKMPALSGLELAVKLKEHNSKINIIFVTGFREYTSDAFAIHASGYVHKPVSPAAVREQMENLRFTPVDPPEPIRVLGPYSFDHLSRRVYKNGQDTLLKPREFYLFCVFANAPGVFFSPEELFRKIWGDDPNGNVHTVYAHVSRLRGKLGMNEPGGYDIEVKRNVGYRLLTPQLCSDFS